VSDVVVFAVARIKATVTVLFGGHQGTKSWPPSSLFWCARMWHNRRLFGHLGRNPIALIAFS